MADNSIIHLTPPKQPEAPNAKWCHRFFIPMTYAEQTPGGAVTPKASAVFVKCLGAECTLWDTLKLKCADKLKQESLDKIELLLERRELSETVAGMGT